MQWDLGAKSSDLTLQTAYAAGIPKSNYPCRICFFMNYYKLYLAYPYGRMAEVCSLTMSIIIYRGIFPHKDINNVYDVVGRKSPLLGCANILS